jgi:hypothetical protein
MRRLRIGRSETNEIVIADASVSRQHAELVELGGGRFTLTDLGSTFGTHVWQNQGWVPAAGTEIGADTVIRFGEYRTTLFDVAGAATREALGLAAPAAAPAPPPAAPPPAAAPSQPVPEPTPPPPSPPRAEAPRVEATPPAERAPPAPGPAEPAPHGRSAARPRRTASERQQLAMRLGLISLGSFFLLAIVAVVVVLTLGEANPPPRPQGPDNAAQGQRKFLETCTKDWKVEDRRCRCFLAAAGPNLQPEDYDDFAEVVENYLTGDADRAESVIQRVNEKRGMHARTRIANAFRGVVRDCQAAPPPAGPR